VRTVRRGSVSAETTTRFEEEAVANVRHPYGPWSRRMFECLKEMGTFKAEAFVCWLAERDIRVDRSLVSHWMNGRTHLPADILVRLSQFTERADVVFGEYLREVGLEPVRLRGTALPDRDIVDLMLEAGATLGRLQRALIQALSPDSPGGREITREECRDLRRRLDDFITRLVGLRAHLKQREAFGPKETA
jgi:hypothetical protein